MREKILELKKKYSLYEIALDIGISESSLYNYVNKYKNVSRKIVNKIERFLESNGEER